MPKLRGANLEEHRREVRDAILDATAQLVREHGLRGVTMSRIAEDARIGRATLYKYFSSVDEILRTWHHRHVGGHLRELEELAARPGSPWEQLAATVEAYAVARRDRSGQGGGHTRDIVAQLHRDPELAPIRGRLEALLGELIAAGADDGQVRSDVKPAELATYCLHALDAASQLPSDAAVERLVTVTLDGLRRSER